MKIGTPSSSAIIVKLIFGLIFIYLDKKNMHSTQKQILLRKFRCHKSIFFFLHAILNDSDFSVDMGPTILRKSEWSFELPFVDAMV